MPPRLRPSHLPSAANVIPESFSSSPLLPFLLPLHHIYTILPSSSRHAQISPSSSRQFSTSKPSNARAARGRFEKTPGTRNGLIDWLKKVAPRLNVPSPRNNVPVYMTYHNNPLPVLQSAGDKKKKDSPLGFKKRTRKLDLNTVDWEKAAQNATMSPFPTNPSFKVHPCISTEFREQIYQRVKQGRSIRRVSAEVNCELERVAAVVRLKEIEKKWIEQNRPLATTMQTRVHAMMPISQWKSFPQHESITDLRIHPATNNQLFLAVPESMPFNRKDAGDALGILPADERMPHSELIGVERMRLQGISVEEMISREAQREKEEANTLMAKRQRMEARNNAGKVVETERFRFRLKPAVTGLAGHRYGVPAEDRKRGITKIPTRVV
ncbi:hypothetical protein H072_7649 [Dactylellina haptotyla CBS 200.50]|uniref:37S ribosomal protein S35, mitochondrial n=1 Tax=Dactylellina haptotyla (strain CBS 200.50) TaxID=1284197 RepID=S8ABQ2_DACHA|nr:hypothetical protein H072_7649 [Dactylellina haptotyla CBS 200.50]